MKPLLSIVIANYNYGRFLEEAIQSILSQDSDDYEIVIVDGGSTDNSIDIIRKYAGNLPPGIDRGDDDRQISTGGKIAWWISEPDKGQSDAFNKGFSHSHGKFLTWLNADDVLLPHTLKKFAKAVKKNPACEWFVGGVFWLDPQMKIIRCRKARPFSEIRYRAGVVSVWGPSSFFSKEMLDGAGGVDIRFHYTMDTDLWLKFSHKLKKRYKPFIDYAWGLRLHPDAKMSGQNFKTSSQNDPNHPKWAQLKKENELIGEYFKPKFKMTRLRRVFSIAWALSIKSEIDSLCYRGKYFMEAFK